jgi:glycosyltransferase involved in cell wall biosynthesis
MPPVHVAFLMEQCMGHVTHALNLRSFLTTQHEVEPTWLPIGYEMAPGSLETRIPYWNTHDTVRGSWRVRRALQAARRRGRVDAAFIHTQSIAMLSADLMRRVPTVLSLDATPINLDSMAAAYGRRPDGDGWSGRRKHQLASLTFRAAAGLVAYSEWVKRSLIEDYQVTAERIHVLAGGASEVYFEIGRERAAAPPAAGAGRPMRILFVGADFERKGGDVLLDSLRGAPAGRFALDVVTRDAAAVAAAGVPDVSIHTGIRPNSDELRRLFAAADVLALPTQADCLAVVAMEAAAAGLPLVVTDVGAMSETVVEGESGFIVPVGGVGALRGALERLSGDAALRQRMGRAGHALASRKFDATRNFRSLMDVLQDVATARPRRRPAAVAAAAAPAGR